MYRITIAILLLLASVFSYASNNSVVILKGFIDTYPITMKLSIQKSRNKHLISGVYSYDKYNKDIPLSGSSDSSYKYLLNEETGNFKLSLDHDCSFSGLSGTWTSNSGKELPVKLLKLTEKSTATSNLERTLTLVQSLTHTEDGYIDTLSSYFLLDNHRIDVKSHCDESIGLFKLSKSRISRQDIYKIFWKMDATGSGYLEASFTVYIHDNGQTLITGTSGDKYGWDAYNKKTCSISHINEDLTKTCIMEKLTHDNDIFIYEENKFVEEYRVTDLGFEKVSINSYTRKNQSIESEPGELFRNVKSLAWEFISEELTSNLN